MENSVAIIACLKCEELYIKEWLDWHIKIGVDHFYLIDNNDSNYLPTLESVIQEYVNKGIVDIFDYKDIEKVQEYCYDIVYQQVKDIYDWYCIIDIDEFITLPKYKDNLKDFLKLVPNYIYIIGLIWVIYDDNNLILYDDRPVQERFTNISFNFNKFLQLKCIFKTEKYSCIQHIQNHHSILLNKNLNIPYKIYDVLFKYELEKTNWYLIKSLKHQNSNYNKYFIKLLNTAYIKHFKYKTLEEYYWQIKRGDALFNRNDKGFPLYLDYFWNINTKTPQKLKYYNKIKKRLKDEGY